MTDPKVPDGPPAAVYVLRLFVTGHTPRSVNAVQNILRICEENLQGHYQLEVVDIYQQPELAAQEQLLAAPTLVKREPLPVKRLVGDMTDEDRVLNGLNLPHRTPPSS